MCELFFKYFIKQKKNILFFIMIIIFALGVSFLKKFENNKITKEKIFSKERIIELLKEDNKNIDKDLGNQDISYEEKIELNNLKKRNIKTIKYFEKLIKDIEYKNWQGIYKFKLNNFLDSCGNFVLNRSIRLNDISYDVNELTTKITFETLNYLKDKNISSSLPLDLEKTEFDNPKTSKESKVLDYYSKKTLVGTSHRLWDFFRNDFSLMYIFIIVIAFGSFFSKIKENKIIRFLKISGVSNFKIVISEIFVGGILTFLLGFFMPLIFFVIEFFVSGISSFKYPITTYFPKDNYFSYMSFGYKIVPMSEVLIKSFVLFLLYGIFIFLFSSVISIFIKSSIKSVILSLGLIFTLQMYNKWYNLFSYWRVGRISDGSINFLFKTVTYSFNKSLKILSIGIFILIILLISISFIKDKRGSNYA